MFTYDDIKMMYDWGNFTDEQVLAFVPICITEEQAGQITGKEIY